MARSCSIVDPQHAHQIEGEAADDSAAVRLEGVI
jgi:hypothetical protein